VLSKGCTGAYVFAPRLWRHCGQFSGFGGSSPVWLRNRKRGPRVQPRKRTRYVLPLIVTGGSTFAIRLTGDRLGVKAAVAWRAIRSGWRGGFVRT
jgi:hypothetical protein